MTLALSIEGAQDNHVEVGKTFNVNVKLNGLQPGMGALWGVGINLPENIVLANPIGAQQGSANSVNSFFGLGKSDLSKLMISVPLVEQSSFSFSALATGAGETTIDASGFAVGFGSMGSGSQFLFAPLTQQLSVTAIPAVPDVDLFAATVPEPSSFALCGLFLGAASIRRRRRHN
ncbi:PEP-CTERM sorting domain-containing protein [Roseiconus sp. JC912]